MQIHELNNYSGDLDSGAYIAVDNGTDTGKVSTTELLADTNDEISGLSAFLNARIDNIIAGGTAPSEAEVTDARLGADGIVYPSLGDAIRDQVSFVSPTWLNLINYDALDYTGFINGSTGAYQSGASGSGLNCCTPFIPVDSEATYYFYRPSSAVTVWNIVEYDASKVYIKSTFASQPVTMSANTAYIRMSLASGETGYNQCSLSKVQNRKAGKSVVLSDVYLNDITLSEDNLILGTRSLENPSVLNSSTTRCTTNVPVFYKAGTSIKNIGSNHVAVYMYDTNLDLVETHGMRSWTEVEIANDAFVHYVFGNPRGTEVTASDFSGFINDILVIPPSCEQWYKSSRSLAEYAKLRNGSVGNVSNANAVATGLIMPVGNISSFTILINRPLSVQGHCYRFQYTTYSTDSGYAELQQNRIDIDITTVLDPDVNIITVYPKSSDSVKGWAFALYEVTDESASSFVPIRVEDIDDDDEAVLIIKNYKESEETKNYVVGSNLLKRPVSVARLGALTYQQAFCKYDGKYYSIDGSNIAEQDASFNVLRNVALSTGHGNALQLGTNGIAYASGWDDNEIYVVNLDDLTIDSTIVLPTTGYTTGVIDEVRNYAYIFQRDSRPDHEDNYNFIVYDLTNQQIISTRKILAYGAMQAADFFNDRIIVLNGLGNSACPNGYRVFDTSGNILADYYFGDFSTTEPEGVCIDRDTHELYVSYVDKNIYKVSI